jgi:hypothetical protein
VGVFLGVSKKYDFHKANNNDTFKAQFD